MQCPDVEQWWRFAVTGQIYSRYVHIIYIDICKMSCRKLNIRTIGTLTCLGQIFCEVHFSEVWVQYWHLCSFWCVLLCLMPLYLYIQLYYAVVNDLFLSFYSHLMWRPSPLSILPSIVTWVYNRTDLSLISNVNLGYGRVEGGFIWLCYKVYVSNLLCCNS